MALSCPICQKTLTLPPLSLKEETDIHCQNCGGRLKLQVTVTPRPQTVLQKTTETIPLNSQKILVAVEGEATYEMICEILSEAKFEVIGISDGKRILELIERHRPQVSIIDVGLPQAFEFVISENIKKRDDLKGVRIILLSSIHDKTKYKREPDSLYGADDYIERHHIHDQLLNKILKILEPQRQSPVSMTSTQTASEALNVTQRIPEKPSIMSDDLPAHDAAKRLARIIISDIALYNQKRIEEGLQNDILHELLKEEIAEGLKLYRSRTPKEIAETTHYYEEALSDFIQKQKAKNIN